MCLSFDTAPLLENQQDIFIFARSVSLLYLITLKNDEYDTTVSVRPLLAASVANPASLPCCYVQSHLPPYVNCI